MDGTVISVLGAVLGSIVGGAASFGSNWAVQRGQIKQFILQRQITKRERLYSAFIKDASRLLAESLAHELTDPSGIVGLYATVGRIRLFGSEPVVQAADAVLRRILANYGQTNLTIDEIRSRALSTEADPFREFGFACRRELLNIR